MGCRATSIALKDLISRENKIIYSIYGDVVSRYVFNFEYVKLFNQKHLTKIEDIVKQFLVKILSMRNLQWIIDFIVESIERSINIFYRKAKRNALYKEILQNIMKCDAIIINGEGDAIFTTPFRRQYLFLLMILKIAQRNGKKTFYVNAMFSDCPKSGRNLKTLNQTINIMAQCTLVIARDLDSFNYLNQFEHSINLKYVPDALFSWTKYGDYICNLLKYPASLIPFPEYDIYWDNFNFTQPYICITGSSSAAWNQKEACIGYIELVQAIKQLDYNLFIVPTCSGDRFLYDVAKQTKTPVIPVNINILGGMAILSNAIVLISGRWHPSILASLGGTPCVILGSNSHKTKSFLNMMDYDKKKEYNAIPEKDEIPNILDDVKDYMQQGIVLRNKIKYKAKEFAELTDFYISIK